MWRSLILPAALAVTLNACGDANPSEPATPQEPTVVGSWQALFGFVVEPTVPSNPEVVRRLECDLDLEIPAEDSGAFSGELTTFEQLFAFNVPPDDDCGEKGSLFSEVAGTVRAESSVQMSLSRSFVSLSGCVDLASLPDLTGVVRTTEIILTTTFECENADAVALGGDITLVAARKQ